MKQCPFCGANIEDSTRFCVYCMTSLIEKEQILLHKKKKPQWTPILVATSFALLVISILLTVPFTKPPVSGSKAPSEEAPPDVTTSKAQTEPDGTPSTDEPLHIHSYSLENPTVEYQKEKATCTAPAMYYYSCSCGEKGSSAFSYGTVADHTASAIPGHPADCVKPGLTDGTLCSVCDTVLLSQSQIPVINHTYSSDKDEECNVCGFVRVLNCKHEKTVKLPAVAPTCTGGGLTEGKRCTLCEEILTAQTALSPSGHKEVTDASIKPTCTASGKTEGKHCSVCGAVLVSQVTVDAKGHTVVVDKAIAATCTTAGKTEGQHCSVCGAVPVPQATVDPIGHTAVVDKAIAPTCTAPGKTEGKHCSVCGTVLLAQQEVSATGHAFDSANPAAPCSVCGEPSPHTHSFSVQNTASKYLKSVATSTTPALYYYSCSCGEKGSATFSYGQPLDPNAKTGTTGDCTWTLDGTVLTVSGNGAMESGYHSLYSDSVGPWGRDITKVIIEDGVTSISAFAFAECTKLKTVKLGNTVQTIGNSAFIGCTALNSINIPPSVTKIDYYAFRDCAALKAVFITDLSAWCSIELYESDRTNPVSVGKGKLYLNGSPVTHLVLPDGMTKLKCAMFSYCSSIKTVVIPEGVTSVFTASFYGCENLETVYLPTSLEKIEYQTFMECTKLSNVYYAGGSMDELNIAWRNEPLVNATWHYNYEY